MARLAKANKPKPASKKAVVRLSQSKKSVRYQDYLISSLRDPEEAAGYLNAALEGGDVQVFLIALQNVVQARGGITAVSEKANKSRTSLYKSLSEKGNPYLKSANEVLMAMGMHFAVVSDSNTTRRSQQR